jgi:cathepsin D
MPPCSNWWWFMQTQFNVVIDTEYGDFFLPGPNCGSSCSGHTIYDPSTSSTAQPIGGATFVGRYDDIDSVATGVGYTDTVTIAGFTATSLTVAAVRPSATFTPLLLTITYIGHKLQFFS